MTDTPRIRRYAGGDVSSVAEVFFRSVHEGTKEHYTREERDAWAGSQPDADRWRKRLGNLAAFVAETPDGIVGFMTLTANGLVDHAFVLSRYRRTGLAQLLYCRIEQEASELGLRALRTDASHYARPFFARLGWVVIREQRVERHGVELTNFAMQKAL